jgi:hypothetical protein
MGGTGHPWTLAMNPSGLFVGIDVAKDRLDVALLPAVPGAAFPAGFANDPAGIADLVARLKALAPELVVLEATGGLETPVLGLMAAAFPRPPPRARSATSPSPSAAWPRRTASTPASWPSSPNASGPNRGPCRRRSSGPSTFS